jgi:limonene-1,2-epoxide hydrolase
MPEDLAVLDQLQQEYKAAVDEWIATIREEEALACVDHSVAEIDKWENAGFSEETARNRAKAVKKKYEDALREKFFNF